MMITHSIGSNAIERWVRKVARVSGQSVDWHWFGGRACILALGDLSRVKSAIVDLLPEHNRLFVERLKKIFPSMKEGVDFIPPRPSWLGE